METLGVGAFLATYHRLWASLTRSPKKHAQAIICGLAQLCNAAVSKAPSQLERYVEQYSHLEGTVRATFVYDYHMISTMILEPI